jgi:AcrR family transcriptional regulator
MNRHSQTREGTQTTLRERLKEATNGAILEAAEGVFVERGLEQAKMEEIAGRAGVSVGTLYNHFTDRDALIDSLSVERRAECLAQLDDALAATEGQPFDVQLTAFVTAYLKHILAHGPFLSTMIEKEMCMPEAGRAPARLIATELAKRSETLTGRGVASGVLRNDGDAKFHANMLWGLTRSIVARYLFRPQPGDPPLLEQVDRITRYFLKGAGV